MLLELVDNIPMKTLPKIGYVAYIGKTPVAIGFLRRVEPCYGQIEIVSNKYTGKLMREDSIQKITQYLLKDAKTLKLKGLIANKDRMPLIGPILSIAV